MILMRGADGIAVGSIERQLKLERIQLGQVAPIGFDAAVLRPAEVTVITHQPRHLAGILLVEQQLEWLILAAALGFMGGRQDAADHTGLAQQDLALRQQDAQSRQGVAAGDLAMRQETHGLQAAALGRIGMAGFAAACYQRGVDFVQVPTTLLAQVDSSVGGKTGINSPQGKNLIGSFHQPVLVIADTAVLDTLSPRQFRAGYAEVAKYGLLGDAAFFTWLEKNHGDVFSGGAAREHAIATSCRAKAAIVARDERETGERALLNLGHTFGHALEAATGFSDRLFHGEGVAVGMVLAAEFSAQLGMIAPDDAARIRQHLAAVGLPTRLQDIAGFAQEGLADADALMALMAQDKKVKRGKLTFILLRAVGNATIVGDVDPAKVHAFLRQKLSE